MTMTIAVTRNAPGRYRGFLASCMLQVVPGVYVAPRMKKAVRERLWEILLDWSDRLPSDGGIALFWKCRTAPSGMGMRLIGWPKKEIVDHEGFWLSHRALRKDHQPEELDELVDLEPGPDPENDEAADDLLAGHLPEPLPDQDE